MGLTETYHYYVEDPADSRTTNWWLMSSPVPVITILASYLYFVLICGSRWMKDAKPYSLKTFITYYNVFQIIANAIIIYMLMTAGWLTHLTVGCEPVDYSMDPMAIQQAEAIWWTMILKLIDLSETAVFVLRKKNKQISFLHLYHHVTTFLITWISVRYFAGAMCTFPIMVNSFVHIIMYSYYLLSSKGPKVQWIVGFIKPYITIIQLVQFCILVMHATQALSPSCDISTLAACFYIGNLMANLVLFINFYRKNYISPEKKAA